MSAAGHRDAHASRPPQAEERLPRRQSLVLFGFTVGVVVASLLVSYAVLRLFSSDRPAARPTPVAREVSGIDQTLIARDRAGVRSRAEQRRVLEAYGWVDQQAGVVRIPITRAFELLLAGEQP